MFKTISARCRARVLVIVFASAIASVFGTTAIVSAQSAVQAIPSGSGREFWIVFQKNFRDFVTDERTHSETPAAELELELTMTSSVANSGYVEVASLGFRQDFKLSPGKASTVQIPKSAQVVGSGAIERLAVHVVAEQPVTVYGLNRRYQTSETFAAIPVSALGTVYRVLGYRWLQNDLVAQMAIVATEDNTVVTINPSTAVKKLVAPPIATNDDAKAIGRSDGERGGESEPAVTENFEDVGSLPYAKEHDVESTSEIPATRTDSDSLTNSGGMPRVVIRRVEGSTITDSKVGQSRVLPRSLYRESARKRNDRVTPESVPSNRTMGEPGTPIKVVLNRGDVYPLIAQYNPSSASDLTGTLVTSSKPVAVFSGHNCAYVPNLRVKACNVLVEQIPPTSTWGHTFGVGTLEGRSGSVVRVVARNDSTIVSLNGKNVATLKAGEFFEEINLQTDAIIITSRPALVAQFSPGFDNGDNVGDPMMLVVPPIEQFDNVYTIATPVRGSWRHYVNVIAKSDAIDGLRIDEHPVNQTLFKALGESGYSIGRVEISYGAHIVTGNKPFGLYQYGLGYDESAYDAYGNNAGQLYVDLDELENLSKPNDENPDLGSLHPVESQHQN